jgi:hypothetical protein
VLTGSYDLSVSPQHVHFARADRPHKREERSTVVIASRRISSLVRVVAIAIAIAASAGTVATPPCTIPIGLECSGRAASS